MVLWSLLISACRYPRELCHILIDWSSQSTWAKPSLQLHGKLIEWLYFLHSWENPSNCSNVLSFKMHFLLYCENQEKRRKIEKLRRLAIGIVNVSIVLISIAWRKFYYYQQKSMNCMSSGREKKKLWFNLAASHDASDTWRIPCGIESSIVR